MLFLVIKRQVYYLSRGVKQSSKITYRSMSCANVVPSAHFHVKRKLAACMGINNTGPNTEHWGTPTVINSDTFFVVFF